MTHNGYGLYSDSSHGYLYRITDLSGTPSPTLKQTFTSRKVGASRKAAGVDTSIGVLSQTDIGSWSKDFDFTATNGNFARVLDFVGSGDLGVWNAGVGWQTEQNTHWYCFVELTIPAATITDVAWTGYSSKNLVGGADNIDIRLEESDGTPHTVALTTGTPSGAQSGSESGTWTDIVKVRIRIGITNSGSNTHYVDSLSLDGTGENPFGTVKHYYSSDNGDTMPAADVGDYRADLPAFDYDDFNLGVVVAAANHNVYFASTYSGAFTALSGLTGEGDTITCIRVPYKIPSTQALNNSISSLWFIYATSTGYTGLVNFNASTGAIASETDISIVIASTTYYVPYEGALESYATDTRKIYAFAIPVGGGDTKLVKSTAYPPVWSIANTFNGRHVHIVEPDKGGNGLKLYVSGDGGNKYSSNGGGQLLSKSASATIQSHYLGT